MKKLIAMMLVLVLALSLVACGAKTDEPAVMPEEDAPAVMPEVDAPVEEMPEVDAPVDEMPEESAPMEDNDASNLLNAIWDLYAEEEQFFGFGGNPASPVENAAGAFDMNDVETLMALLQLDAETLANFDEAALFMHAMNANTFTSAALRPLEGTDVQAVAQAMRDSIQSAQWICGFPEQLIIASVEGHLLMAFGVKDTMTVFETRLGEAFPEAEILFNEPIEG